MLCDVIVQRQPRVCIRSFGAYGPGLNLLRALLTCQERIRPETELDVRNSLRGYLVRVGGKVAYGKFLISAWKVRVN